MKFKLAVLFVLNTFFLYNTEAQPLVNKHIEILNIFYNCDALYYQGNGLIKNNNYFIEKKRGINNMVLLTIFDKGDYLKIIYDRDTMQIKLLYHKYDPLEINIKNLHFAKGKFTIDLYSCIKKEVQNTDTIALPFILKNFPCDCVNYIKKGE